MKETFLCSKNYWKVSKKFLLFINFSNIKKLLQIIVGMSIQNKQVSGKDSKENIPLYCFVL